MAAPGPATIGTVTPEPSFLPLVLHGGVVYGLQMRKCVSDGTPEAGVGGDG